MTTPDPLATLLHETVCDDGVRYGYHPFCETFAARLRASGVRGPEDGLRDALDNAAADHEEHVLRFTFDEGDEDHSARGAILLCESCADEIDRPLIVLRDWDRAALDAKSTASDAKVSRDAAPALTVERLAEAIRNHDHADSTAALRCDRGHVDGCAAAILRALGEGVER